VSDEDLTEPEEQLLELTSEAITDTERLRDIKAQIKALEMEEKYLEEWACKEIGKQAVYERDNLRVKATVVQGVSESLDLDVLESVSPLLYAEVTETKVVLVPEKLKRFKEAGFFDTGKPAAAAISRKNNKPYVKFTVTDTSEETGNE
jgi:N-methylhydantoinase B/oxoprolinase/acetone carboxylase alpha subunit